MQGLFILSLLVLTGCGIVDCLGYFDRGFLVLQGSILCIGVIFCYFIKGGQRVREYIGILAAVEWLMSYGHFGPALGAYGLITVFLLFNRTLEFPRFSQMMLFCVLIGAICVSRTPWSNHQQIIFGMIIGTGLLGKEGAISQHGQVWRQLIVSCAAVLALCILGAEYRYYYHGESHVGIVHPHYIGSILLCSLMGFWISWRGVARSPKRVINVISLMVSTVLVYVVVSGFGAAWWKYVGFWWGGRHNLDAVTRELAVPSGWLIEGAPYLGFLIFVMIGCTLIFPIFSGGIFRVATGIRLVPVWWSFLAIGGITPVSTLYSVENEASGQKRSWVAPIVIVVLSVGFFRLWEHRSYYFHGGSRGEPAATLTPVVRTLLSAEDIFFCEHSGVDFARFKWVLRDTLRRGSFDRGASTLTMQLVKVRHLSYEKSIFRKFLQVLVALWYEARFDKNEIANLYLNEVSFGPYITGIEQASQFYFQKASSSLGLREIEYLVATIEDPTHFTPQQLPNVPKDVAGRLEHIRGIRAEFGPYFSKACENS
jgi:hypothetical protein